MSYDSPTIQHHVGLTWAVPFSSGLNNIFFFLLGIPRQINEYTWSDTCEASVRCKSICMSLLLLQENDSESKNVVI